MLKGTKLESLSKSFYNAERKYKINAIFLMGLVAQESGFGTSARSSYQNNLSGFTVYGDNAVGTYFNSKNDSIMATAKLISKYYINPNGKYYNGTSIWSINKNYCQDGTGFYWADSINSISNKLLKRLNK